MFLDDSRYNSDLVIPKCNTELCFIAVMNVTIQLSREYWFSIWQTSYSKRIRCRYLQANYVCVYKCMSVSVPGLVELFRTTTCRSWPSHVIKRLTISPQITFCALLFITTIKMVFDPYM